MSYTNGAARNGSGAYGSLWAPGQRPDRLEHAPPFPTTVHATLPAPLRLAAGHFAAGAERDVFLTGALTVLSGMMPQVQAYNIDGAYAPHLLSIVVAPASAGKGALRYARGLGYSTQKFIEAEYEREHSAWLEASAVDKKGAGPPPPPRMLFIPADASASALKGALASGSTSNILWASELDTLSKTMGQDWGDYSDILRCAFHHEDASSLRVGQGTFTVAKVYLAACLSGTPAQLARLVRDPENGLFSRFGYYVFAGERKYRSQRPTMESRERPGYVLRIGAEWLEGYRALLARERPLEVVMEDRHWDFHDDTFGGALDAVVDQDRPLATDSTVKRAGVIALRVTTILTTYRAFTECGPGHLYTSKSLTATDEDVEAGVRVASTWMDHAARLITHFPSGADVGPKIRAKNSKLDRLLSALPAEFSTGEAVVTGSSLDMAERTVKRYLTRGVEEGDLLDAGHGRWKKTGAYAPAEA